MKLNTFSLFFPIMIFYELLPMVKAHNYSKEFEFSINYPERVIVECPNSETPKDYKIINKNISSKRQCWLEFNVNHINFMNKLNIPKSNVERVFSTYSTNSQNSNFLRNETWNVRYRNNSSLNTLIIKLKKRYSSKKDSKNFSKLSRMIKYWLSENS